MVETIQLSEHTKGIIGPDDLMNMYLETENVAIDKSDDLLTKIATYVRKGYDIDKESRSGWEKRNKEALRLARQLEEVKKWGGEDVSNVKYPLIATASIQFSARAYANIVKAGAFIKCKHIGRDPDGKKANRSYRVSTHMNWQLAEQMNFDEQMDQLLMVLPVIGCAFKKTYRDFTNNMNISEYINPEHLVVNYMAKSMEQAPRITHVLELTLNDYLTRVRSGIWLDIGLEKHSPDGHDQVTVEAQEQASDGTTDDDLAPYVFLEQHTWYDLDDDGYMEPWIITVHKDSGKVVRIMPRFDANSIIRNIDGQIVKINALQYFTRYIFFPAFDNNFYGMGFGILLAPINETINTTINQLLDSGTINNRQSGFINRGIRLTKGGATGTIRFKPGEWKTVQTAGDDIRKGILPLPTHEPSPTLFQLLGLMLEAGRDLASQAEVLSGEQTQPNVPATTTLALIEQGLKVFSSIYKRIHRGLKLEYQKMRRLNRLYTAPEEYNNVIDVADPANPQVDYDASDMDIVPVASTADVSDTQSMLKSQALMELRGQGLDDQKILRRYLEALQIDDVNDLFPEEQPPDPNVEFMRNQIALQHVAVQQKERELDLKEYELVIKDAEAYERMIKLRADAIKSIAQAEGEEAGSNLQQYQAITDRLSIVLEDHKARLEAQHEARKLRDQQEGVPAVEGSPDNTGNIPGAAPAQTAA